MEFFDFGNSETFHVFKWASSQCPQVDVPALIAKAFELAAEEEEGLEVDTSHAVRDKLADLLEEAVIEAAPAADFDNAEPIGYPSTYEPDPFQTLWVPIMAHMVRNINFEAAAEALLRQAGKWAPDKEPPEMAP